MDKCYHQLQEDFNQFEYKVHPNSFIKKLHFQQRYNSLACIEELNQECLKVQLQNSAVIDIEDSDKISYHKWCDHFLKSNTIEMNTKDNKSCSAFYWKWMSNYLQEQELYDHIEVIPQLFLDNQESKFKGYSNDDIITAPDREKIEFQKKKTEFNLHNINNLVKEEDNESSDTSNSSFTSSSSLQSSYSYSQISQDSKKIQSISSMAERKEMQQEKKAKSNKAIKQKISDFSARETSTDKISIRNSFESIQKQVSIPLNGFSALSQQFNQNYPLDRNNVSNKNQKQVLDHSNQMHNSNQYFSQLSSMQQREILSPSSLKLEIKKIQQKNSSETEKQMAIKYLMNNNRNRRQNICQPSLSTQSNSNGSENRRGSIHMMMSQNNLGHFIQNQRMQASHQFILQIGNKEFGEKEQLFFDFDLYQEFKIYFKQYNLKDILRKYRSLIQKKLQNDEEAQERKSIITQEQSKI